MKATKPLTLQIWDMKLYGFAKTPICTKIELIGPLSANNVKNNIAKADAIIKFGK